MSADLLRHSPRQGPRPAHVRALSSAPQSDRPSSANSDSSGSTVSSASSTNSYRNRTLLKTYHDFAMQIFNPGHAQDVENLFLAAARDGDLERVENFLRRRSSEIVNIDVKEKRTGNTPIIWAAKNGHLKIVQLLLKYGADITIRNYDNETAMEVAKPGIRTALLQSVERTGCSPRHLLQAAWQGNIDVVQRLLNESKVLDINCRNADGYTPLLLVTRDVDLFEQIGAALEDYNPQAVVRELLAHRADVTTHDAEGRTPLHFAAASKAKVSEEIALVLMSDPSILEMRDRRSLAPIHSASQSGQVEVLVALLDSGADVNARGFAGATPLHISACAGQLQAATKLLNHGADVTLVDDSGNTPVDVAKTKKLKHALKEAWTEATQAKRDLVLTPVKPPSRVAEHHGLMAEERLMQESIGSTPRPGSSCNFTPEKRIIHKMTEAHKAMLAEEQMLRDIESGRFTPSSCPRKLGLPRASSRNSTSSGKLPIPPKTPRVLDHGFNSSSPAGSPEKNKKTRPLLGGRTRTLTVPSGESTIDIRNQRARAHAKVNQRNSDPVVSKVTTDMPQVPVTVVGLDLDDNLRDIRFRRLVSGPISPYLERRRSHDKGDGVNPTPPTERRPSAGSRGSTPSLQDLTGACVDLIKKGVKYHRSVGSSSSTISLDDESSTQPPRRVPLRANTCMQIHHLNLEQMHLRLGTPSPSLDPTQLFNPTSRNVMPLSPSHYSENIQATIFEFDNEDEGAEDGHSQVLFSNSPNLEWKGESKSNNEHLTLMRSKSILNHSKPFSIENTRVMDPSKDVSTDSGQGSRTSYSVSSSASTLSTPSPLQPRADKEMPLVKSLVTNRLGVKMTPNATNVKESPVKTRTANPVTKRPCNVNSAVTKQIDTKASTEIPLHSAKTLVVENSDTVPASVAKKQQSQTKGPEKWSSKSCGTNFANKDGKINSKFSPNLSATVHSSMSSVQEAEIEAKSGSVASAGQADTKSKSTVTSDKAQSSHQTAVSSSLNNSKQPVGDGKKHKTAFGSQSKKDQPGKQTKSTSKPTGNEVQSLSANRKGSNSILFVNTKPASSSDYGHCSSRTTAAGGQNVHETAVNKADGQFMASSDDVTNTAVTQCKTAETELLFGRLNGQRSSKKSANVTSDPGTQKTEQKASNVKTATNFKSKSVGKSQAGTDQISKPPRQANKQGKSLSPQKISAQNVDQTINKTLPVSSSGEMPKVSPRPGYCQGSKSPAGSLEKASPRLQTSKGEPSLSKSFGSGSSQVKTELRNMLKVQEGTDTNTRQPLSSDEGVGLELEEPTDKDKVHSSDEKQTVPFQKTKFHSQEAEAEKNKHDDSHNVGGKKSPVIEMFPSSQTLMKGQNGIEKKDKDGIRPKTGGSKSDSVESIEEVYEEVVFVSDEEKERKLFKVETEPSQDTVKINIKEVDMFKETKILKQKKVARKTAGRIIPAVKSQPKSDSENKIGGATKSALTAVGKSMSDIKLQTQKPPLTPQSRGTVHDRTEEKDLSGKTKKIPNPVSPKFPSTSLSKFHWSKFKSPEVSPRSDSSVDAPHDPRIIKEHTPVIRDVIELMQMGPLQPGPTPIPWKPREKISSTSSCPNPIKPSSLVKTRRRIASTKELPRKSSVKGSLRKIAIMGQNAQKGKAGRPGSGGKSRQKGKKKQEPDAISSQKKGKLRPLMKTKGKNLKLDKLHLLSEVDSSTKAFITGQGWHIQTEKNETSDVIIHDRSALDSSCDSSVHSGDAPLGHDGSPKLSPHNTLILNELCKIHPLSPAVISNIANIMSPLEVDTPHFIPDTMGTIKEFGDSLKSSSSAETDMQNRPNSTEKAFTFETESVEKLTKEASSHPEKPPQTKENTKTEVNHTPANQLSINLKPLSGHDSKDSKCDANLDESDRTKNHHATVDGGDETIAPRITTSGSSSNPTERNTFDVESEEVSSYETNPDFLRVLRLQDNPSANVSPRSTMFRAELAKEISKMDNDQSVPPETSTEQSEKRDTIKERISHKPPLPSNIHVNISELTRVPRGSVKRRHSEPPAKVSKDKQEALEKAEDVRNMIPIKNSWEEEAENPNSQFVEDGESKIRSHWREHSQVEDMVSPLKSRLPDKNFSPPSSSKESPTRRRGNSVPEVVSQEQHGRNGKRSLEDASNLELSAVLPSQRKSSTRNYSEGSEVFLNDDARNDDGNDDEDEDDAVIDDKEQILTEHVQHMSMNAMQELNTVLSQTGDIHFDFPSPTLRPASRELDTESVGFEPEAADWLNQSLAASEASDITTRTFSAMSSELQNTQSSGLSSERSHSSSTNFSESEGGLLHWKKGNVLGRGAFGVVYCGLTNTGQLIAVKQVELSDKDNKHKSRQQYEKLQEEVELLKTLRHRNIVGFLGVSLEGSTVNIFMQYIPGGSIASLLARFGALEEPVFCRYTKQILQGTEYLHAKNVIHRDIKGANIMLMSNGVIKLIDFGCAKRLCINISQSQNLLKSMRGTPYWMAPEVIMETGHGKKSDIWSIGCTVFEMATRKPPWSEMPPMTAIFAIGSGGPVPQLPEKFSCFAREFVNACLTRDQDERPTATQLLTHSFIRKRRERGRDRFETRISSSTMEDANIKFKEQVRSEDDRHKTEKRTNKKDPFS
ncbi:uncharacterized protein LOC110982351 [Acanthaster planci]|uniref:Mitogen-activated protein kinase kinase kinase 19 n=1 Tax=Acanthaster planci TaxID=133434 RepID=A0A8B7YV69_ACAPL|nr:uncharacterized protein LOC110982351 [Acanthaster planci]XP_022096380.1 uncharacterized protein LOC110982351 [Acanthaster planci]XP_022096381.1 uncharacterized protein LOC110982351 [Acanthaster planci]